MSKLRILLDDGVFFIERNVNGSEATANGFLLRRCVANGSAPSGHECVGGYELGASGEWRASINAPYDEETDSDCCELEGNFKTNLDAIVALWFARHNAYSKH